MRYLPILAVIPFAIGLIISNFQLHKAHVQTQEALRASHAQAIACFNQGYAYGELHELENETHQRINYNHTPSEGCRK